MTLRAQTACMPELQRHFQRRLHGLRAAAAVDDMTEVRTELAQDEPRKLLENVGREQIPVGTGDSLELRRDGIVHFAVRMTDAESGRSAGAIQVPPPLGIKQVTALATNDAWQMLQSKADGTVCARGIVCTHYCPVLNRVHIRV